MGRAMVEFIYVSRKRDRQDEQSDVVQEINHHNQHIDPATWIVEI
jgi:hypothetical protein